MGRLTRSQKILRAMALFFLFIALLLWLGSPGARFLIVSSCCRLLTVTGCLTVDPPLRESDDRALGGDPLQLAAGLEQEQWEKMFVSAWSPDISSMQRRGFIKVLGLAADTTESAALLVGLLKPRKDDLWTAWYLYGCKFALVQKPLLAAYGSEVQTTRDYLDSGITSGPQHGISRIIKERHLDATSASIVQALYDSGVISSVLCPDGGPILDEALSATLSPANGEWKATAPIQRGRKGIRYSEIAGTSTSPRRLVALTVFKERHWVAELEGIWTSYESWLVRLDRTGAVTGLWYLALGDGVSPIDNVPDVQTSAVPTTGAQVPSI